MILLSACATLLVAPRVWAAEDADHAHDHDHSDHDHSHDEEVGHVAHGANTTEAEIQFCATDPGSADCVTFEYPDTTAIENAKVNCQMMPFMVACDVVEACEDGSLAATNPHCDPFDLLASTCKDQGMQQMEGCIVYTPLCLNASTVVEICKLHPGIPEMVNSMPTVEGIASACESESLPGCANCTSGAAINCPDTLESLNALCQADPTKAVCAEREAMCVATGDNLSMFCEGVTATGSPTEVATDTSGVARVTCAAVAGAAAVLSAALLA